MPKPQFLQVDTLDDRREIWSLLHRLPPVARVAFLARCCERIRLADPHGNGPFPQGFEAAIREAGRCDRGNDRLTNVVYCDLVAASGQWDLDLAAVAVELEYRVRHGALA